MLGLVKYVTIFLKKMKDNNKNKNACFIGGGSFSFKEAKGISWKYLIY